MASQLRILALVSLLSLLSGCSVNGNIEDIIDNPTSPIANLNRQSPDFISGEVVTSASGYRGVGVLGENSEKKTSTNSYQMEGAFYE